MSDLVTSAALVCSVLGIVCGALVLVRTREPGQAAPVLLEFLVAAGLLRLSTDETWRALATAAVVIGLRRLVGTFVLRRTTAPRAGTTSSRTD